MNRHTPGLHLNAYKHYPPTICTFNCTYSWLNHMCKIFSCYSLTLWHLRVALPETHTRKKGDQARLPAQLAGQWGQRNLNSVRWRKNILYWAEAALADQKSHVSLLQTQRTNQGCFVFFEFPFTSVSTVSRGHPSLVFRSSTYHSLGPKPQKLEEGYRTDHFWAS